MLFQNGERIVFAGDSVTDFARRRPVGEGLHEGTGTGYVRVIENMINAFYPEICVRISNMGISGNNVIDLKNRYDDDVLALNPDWVSICIGINDVWRFFDSPTIFNLHIDEETYKTELEKLILKTKPVVKGIVLMTPYYIESRVEDEMRAKMDNYGKIVKELAKKHDCIFVDLQAMFDKYLKHRHSTYIAWDRVHPNTVGATLIAREFLAATGFDFDRLK